MFYETLSRRWRRSAGAAWRTGSLFARDERGVTAVEFAIISMPFFMLLCTIFECALFTLNQANLDAAAYIGSRDLFTNNIQTTNTGASAQYTALKNNICSRLSSYACNNLSLNVQSATGFAKGDATVGTMTSSTSTSTMPSSGQVAVIQISYPYKLFFSNYYSGFQSKTPVITSTVIFRVE